MHDMPARRRRSATARRDARATQEEPFDLWLRDSLRTAFDGIAQEPVPADLLRMIEEDREERERLRRRRLGGG